MSPMSLALAGRFFTNRCHLGSLILIPYSNFPKSFQSYLFKFNFLAAAAAAKSLQSCPTLCDPIDSSPPGSPVPEILQARTPEWVAIAFSSAWKWKMKVKSLSRVQLFATPWTAAHQAPPSMGFSRQEDWSGVPLPSPLISLNYHQKRLTCCCLFFTWRLIALEKFVGFCQTSTWICCFELSLNSLQSIATPSFPPFAL